MEKIKLYARGSRHIVIINKIDRTLDCYTNDVPEGDYKLRERFKTTKETDEWLHNKVLPLYERSEQ